MYVHSTVFSTDFDFFAATCISKQELDQSLAEFMIVEKPTSEPPSLPSQHLSIPTPITPTESKNLHFNLYMYMGMLAKLHCPDLHVHVQCNKKKNVLELKTFVNHVKELFMGRKFLRTHACCAKLNYSQKILSQFHQTCEILFCCKSYTVLKY